MKKRSLQLASALVALLFSVNALADTYVLSPNSPSWTDSNDLLKDTPPRLAIAAPALGLVAGDVIDAVSDGHDKLVISTGDSGEAGVFFSVRGPSVGLAGTGVEAERLADTGTGLPNGHACDVFLSNASGTNVLTPSPWGWTLGSADGDQLNAGLQVPVGANPSDNVNAYDVRTLALPMGGAGGGPGGGPNGDIEEFDPEDPDDPDDPDDPNGGVGGVLVPSGPIYFSLRVGSPTLAAIGAGPGDVLCVGGSCGPVPQIFVAAATMGIPSTADVDSISLETVPDQFGNPAVRLLRFTVNNASVGFVVNGVLIDSGADLIAFEGTATFLEFDQADVGLALGDDIDALEGAILPEGFYDNTDGGDNFGGGMQIQPLGDAVLVPGQPLDVTNIGDNNLDGVRFDFPPALSWCSEATSVAIPDDGTVLLGGLKLTSTAHGVMRPTFGDGATPFEGSATVQQNDGWTSVEFDWNVENGAGTVLVEVWDDTDLVHASEANVDEQGLQLDLDLGSSLESVAFTQMVRTTTNIESGTVLFLFCNIVEIGPYRIHTEWDIVGPIYAVALTSADLTGASAGEETGELTVTKAEFKKGVLFGGVPHSALGSAHLEAVDDGLLVSKIGDSSRDGVDIELGSATEVAVDFPGIDVWEHAGQSLSYSLTSGGEKPDETFSLNARDDGDLDMIYGAPIDVVDPDDEPQGGGAMFDFGRAPDLPR